MSRLILHVSSTQRLLWVDDSRTLAPSDFDLLANTTPMARRLFAVLLVHYNGREVEPALLKKDFPSFKIAWKALCDAIAPPFSPRGSLYTISLPSDVSEADALLLLKKTGKNRYLLHVRDDRPDVWVDMWSQNSSIDSCAVPRYPTLFIERPEQQRELLRILQTEAGPSVSRLITVTGAPGCGKTRFAVEAVSTLSGNFSGKIYFVPLIPLSTGLSPESLAAYICRTIKIAEQPGKRAIDSLQEHFGVSRALIILDNCEGSVNQCSAFVQLALPLMPNLFILATSTMRLRIPEETEIVLPPMECPPNDLEVTSEDLGHFPATRLFLDRAKKRDDTPQIVAHVCRALDGLPLFIEIVASALPRSMSLDDFTARLDSNFLNISQGHRINYPHHNTVQAVLDWAYLHLSGDAQMLLRRLAIFVGPISLKTIQHVCSDVSLSGDAAWSALFELADHSLVVVLSFQGTTQFSLLETVKRYGRSLLEATEELREVSERKQEYFKDAIERLERSYSSDDEPAMVHEISAEYDDLIDSMQIYQRDNEVVALAIASKLWRYWQLRAMFDEGRSILRSLLERLPTDTATRPRALAWNRISILSRDLGQHEEARDAANYSLSIFEQLDDRDGIARAQHSLGASLWSLGQYQEAEAVYLESMAYWKEASNGLYVAYTLNNLGNIYYRQKRYADAQQMHKESAALKRKANDKWGEAYSKLNLAQALMREGKFESSLKHLDQCLKVLERVQDKKGVALVRMNTGILEHRTGQYEAALSTLEDALSLMEKAGDISNSAYIISEIGMVKYRLGQTQQGIEEIMRAMELFQEMPEIAGIVESLENLIEIMKSVGELDSARLILELVVQLEDSFRIPKTNKQLAETTFTASDGYPDALPLSEISEYVRLLVARMFLPSQ